MLLTAPCIRLQRGEHPRDAEAPRVPRSSSRPSPALCRGASPAPGEVLQPTRLTRLHLAPTAEQKAPGWGSKPFEHFPGAGTFCRLHPPPVPQGTSVPQGTFLGAAEPHGASARLQALCCCCCPSLASPIWLPPAEPQAQGLAQINLP